MNSSKQEKLKSIATDSIAKVPEASRTHYLNEEAGKSLLIQRYLQKQPKAYAFIQSWLAPALRGPKWRQHIPKSSDTVVVNLGCGAYPLDRDMINVDFVAFPHVDIAADFSVALPIRTASVDAVISISVFEHMQNPDFLAAEVRRILKPGGVACLSVPFLYPFHAAPNDFSRWTQPGVSNLLGSEFELLTVEAIGTGVGVLILAISHLMAQLFSFKSHKLYALINYGFMGLLSPLKLLDLIFSHLPFATTLAPNLFIAAKKRS